MKVIRNALQILGNETFCILCGDSTADGGSNMNAPRHVLSRKHPNLVIPNPVKPKSAHMRVNEFVGQALQVIRVKRGLLQEEVAVRLSQEVGERIRQSYISKIENSHTGIRLERLASICRCLKCTPSQVIEIAEFLAVQDARSPAKVARDIEREVKVKVKSRPRRRRSSNEISLLMDCHLNSNGRM